MARSWLPRFLRRTAAKNGGEVPSTSGDAGRRAVDDGATAAKNGEEAPGTWDPWKRYIQGQGVVLFFFILLGGLLAWISSYFGPLVGRVSTGGELVEYRRVDLTEVDVFTDSLNVANYSRLIVLTRTIAPQNSSATIIIYGVRDDGVTTEVKRMQSLASSWSSWEQENLYTSLRLIVERPAEGGMTSADEVDVLIYASP